MVKNISPNVQILNYVLSAGLNNMFVAILLLTVSINGILTTPMSITHTVPFVDEGSCKEFIMSEQGKEWVQTMVNTTAYDGSKVISIDRTFCTVTKEEKI